jgi:hypothetical protein
VNAEVEIVSYQILPGTVVVLGLYLNGLLKSNQTYTLTTDSASYQARPTGLINSSEVSANFTNNMVVLSVWLVKTPIASGSVITTTVWASHPLWLRSDTWPSTHSYETFNVVSSTLPSTADSRLGLIAPYVVTVMVESD